MFPKYFVCPRVGVHFAFKVNIVPLFDVIWIEAGAKRQVQNGHIWKHKSFQSFFYGGIARIIRCSGTVREAAIVTDAATDVPCVDFILLLTFSAFD